MAQAPTQPLRVAVTGGSGKIGREAVRALVAAGHGIANFDLKPSPDGARTTIVDCTDFGQCLGALSGVDLIGERFDAVLHLAGIPAPGLAPDHEVFRANTLSTYNVFSACRRLGIDRIVWASSETLHGLPFATPPDFLPIDEDHPLRPEWSYSLAKRLGETMAEEFARWSPRASITSLRFSNAFDGDDYRMLASLRGEPAVRRLNLWAYVDARDCGEACRLAIEAALPGHQALIIAAGDTVSEIETAELARRFFPQTPLRSPLPGRASLLSSSKAEQLIGYRPRHSWRSA